MCCYAILDRGPEHSFVLFLLNPLKYFTMALAIAHAWCEHHQKLLGIRRLGGPEGFAMGDSTVRRPVATPFDKGVDFGLIVHKNPLMADDKDPLGRNNYIFELLELNPGVAGFVIRLHPENVEAVVESVTAQAQPPQAPRSAGPQKDRRSCA